MAQATPPQRKRRIPRRLRGLLLAVVIVGMILLTLALLSLEFGPPEQNAE